MKVKAKTLKNGQRFRKSGRTYIVHNHRGYCEGWDILDLMSLWFTVEMLFDGEVHELYDENTFENTWDPELGFTSVEDTADLLVPEVGEETRELALEQHQNGDYKTGEEYIKEIQDQTPEPQESNVEIVDTKPEITSTPSYDPPSFEVDNDRSLGGSSSYDSYDSGGSSDSGGSDD